MFLITDILNKILDIKRLRDFGIKSYKWGYKKGFTSQTLEVCGITKDNYKDFISDRDYALGHPYNGTYSAIIDNKLWLPMLLHNYEEYIPKYYFFKDNRGFLPMCSDVEISNVNRSDISSFFDLLKREKTLALKHSGSSLGQGFLLVKQEDNHFYCNNVEYSEAELKEKIEGLTDYLVTEYVKQHSYSSSINASSLNTMRFLCVWDDDTKSFFLARVFHRFGFTGDVVDNLASGNGVCYFVDPETGVFKSEGVVNFNNTGDKYVKNPVHPNIGKSLSGFKVPRFDEVKEKVLEIANSISFLKYVGFDIAITEDSFKIIEINSLSSLDFVQQREGFLKDSRIRKVLKK